MAVVKYILYEFMKNLTIGMYIQNMLMFFSDDKSFKHGKFNNRAVSALNEMKL